MEVSDVEEALAAVTPVIAPPSPGLYKLKGVPRTLYICVQCGHDCLMNVKGTWVHRPISTQPICRNGPAPVLRTDMRKVFKTVRRAPSKDAGLILNSASMKDSADMVTLEMLTVIMHGQEGHSTGFGKGQGSDTDTLTCTISKKLHQAILLRLGM